MSDEFFARLRTLNPTVIDAAKTVAKGAVAAMPDDLEPTEEPAHIYRAASPNADDLDREA